MSKQIRLQPTLMRLYSVFKVQQWWSVCGLAASRTVGAMINPVFLHCCVYLKSDISLLASYVFLLRLLGLWFISHSWTLATPFYLCGESRTPLCWFFSVVSLFKNHSIFRKWGTTTLASCPLLRDVRNKSSAHFPLLRDVRNKSSAHFPKLRKVRNRSSASCPLLRDVKNKSSARFPLLRTSNDGGCGSHGWTKVHPYKMDRTDGS